MDLHLLSPITQTSGAFCHREAKIISLDGGGEWSVPLDRQGKNGYNSGVKRREEDEYPPSRRKESR